MGIEERMVPHMGNKKQDCKKIEELKRQYAGSEMSGEQVEQMKKQDGQKFLYLMPKQYTINVLMLT